MAEYITIPDLAEGQRLTWNRLGIGNHAAFYDVKAGKWIFVKFSGVGKELKPYYDQPNLFVRYQDWESGKKTVPTPKEVTQYTGKTTDEVAADAAVNSAVITFEGGQPIVTFTTPNPADPKGDPVTYTAYLYVDDKGGVSLSPDDARAGIVTGKEFNFDKTDAARDKHLNDLYKTFGSRQGIINALYDAGFLNTNKNVPTDAMLQAVNGLIAQYTVDQVEAYKSKQITEFSTLTEWLKNYQGAKPESLAGTRTQTQVTEFSDTDARALIDDVAQQLLQRMPTEKEYAKLVPLIQKKQRKNPALVSTTTDEKGRVVASKTKTGLNERQFLVEKLSNRDEAKANMIMSYYDAFKQAIGVR